VSEIRIPVEDGSVMHYMAVHGTDSLPAGVGWMFVHEKSRRPVTPPLWLTPTEIVDDLKAMQVDPNPGLALLVLETEQMVKVLTERAKVAESDQRPAIEGRLAELRRELASLRALV